jgi:hypothetical protein
VRAGKTVLGFLIGALVAGAVAGAVVLVVARRMRTGEWGVPGQQDFVWVKQRLAPERAAPRVIYLNREPVALVPAPHDDSHANRSGLIEAPVELPGWKGSAKGWASVVRCVEAMFAPYDVRVVTERPAERGYVMVLVGGRARDFGEQVGHHVSGLAPYNGDVVLDPIVFAFARETRHEPRAVCETIAMEVGHAYGLDHGYLCKDVMTYLPACGKRSFVDKDVRCGEHARRDCMNGKPTQNSHRHLLGVLGERPTVDAISGG